MSIAISVAEKIRQLYLGGLPAADLRSPDEPLLGTISPETSPAPAPAMRPRMAEPIAPGFNAHNKMIWRTYNHAALISTHHS